MLHHRLFCLKSLKRLGNFAARVATRGSTARRKFCNVYVNLSCLGGIGIGHNDAKYFIDNFEDEIKRAKDQGEKYLAQMMRVLRTLILQTSIEYQQCLIKQIETTLMCTKIGPLGEHWDQLTAFRVAGKELKDELNRYEALAKSISDLVQREVESSVALGGHLVLEELTGELHKLRKLCNEQLQEIYRYEAELLAANRDSILHGVRKDL